MDPQTAQVIVSLITAVVSIVTVIFAYKAQVAAKEAKTEAAASTEQGNANGKAIEVVRNDVNDKMQQFISLSKTSSHAEGVKEEMERDKGPVVELPDVVKVKLVEGEDTRTGTQKAANEARKGLRE